MRLLAATLVNHGDRQPDDAAIGRGAGNVVDLMRVHRRSLLRLEQGTPTKIGGCGHNLAAFDAAGVFVNRSQALRMARSSVELSS
jgi:hypothetical protein